MKRWSLPLALLGLCATNGWAATHVVEADGSGDFPTIQAAINAAARAGQLTQTSRSCRASRICSNSPLRG